MALSTQVHISRSLRLYHPFHPFVLLSLMFAALLSVSLVLTSMAPITPTASGRVIRHELNITSDYSAPDCYARPTFLINGAFPGPTMNVHVGDELHVRINNHLFTESISIHLHGLHQRGSPFFDGAAGITQDPIPAETSIELRVRIGPNEVGTHFYHAHHGLLEQSVFGALIVHDETDKKVYNYSEERVLMLSDWWHQLPSEQETGLLGNPKFRWIGDAHSILTNGASVFEGCANRSGVVPKECQEKCSGPHVTTVTKGKTYRFRIINAGTLGYFGFAIAGHTMKIIEVDNARVVPYTVKHLEINAGQRYSVLIEANQPTAEYWMHTAVRWRASGPTNGQSILRYEGAEPGKSQPPNPAELPHIPVETSDWILKDLKPLQPVAPPAPSRNIVLVGKQTRIDKFIRWAMNDLSFTMPHKAILRSAYEGTLGLLPINQRPIRLEFDEVVDVTLVNTVGLDGVCEEHPWHLHGHSFWVVGWGNGAYDESSATYLNTVDPILRDTVTLYPSEGAFNQPKSKPGTHCGWVKIRFVANNPGIFPLHCHIQSHFMMGMAVVFEEGIDRLPPLPKGYPAWVDKWTPET